MIYYNIKCVPVEEFCLNLLLSKVFNMNCDLFIKCALW